VHKEKEKNIYLVGFMASGKSRQGQLLAATLKRPFLDTDAVITGAHNRTVTEIFEHYGEPWFRDQEMKTVKLIAENPSQVIALGGGTPVRDDIWPILKTGHTIYLHRSESQLLHQLRKFKNRPLLSGIDSEGMSDYISKMLRDREPYYKKADHTFYCKNGWSRNETARHLLTFVKKKIL